MFFEHENKTEFLKRTAHLSDHEFRDLFNLLINQPVEQEALSILMPLEPYELATLLNHTVFGCLRIDEYYEEIINENPECKGNSGSDGVQ